MELFLTEICSSIDLATVEEDAKKTKKKKKLGDRFKLEVDDEDGVTKYILAVENSTELAE